MTGPLTVAYRGNFQPNLRADQGPPWSTEFQVAATLEAMGHTVLRLQEDAVDWPTALTVARQADLFLWTQTWNRDPEGAVRALDALRAAGVPSVSFHLDLYVGLEREHQIDDYPFWRTDHVFTADGGHDDRFRRAGVNHHWLTPAIYGPEARTGTPTGEDHWPIIFVGGYPYSHPEHAPARRDIITTVQSRWQREFRVYQRGYRLGRLADLIASATIVVGDSCLAGRSPNYWSDRIPETLGRAGFLIHPHVEGMERDYTDGEHLRTFEPGDMRHLSALVEHYMRHPAEAAAIGRAGQAHVRAHHTYEHRLRAMLDVVFPPAPRRPGPRAKTAAAVSADRP